MKFLTEDSDSERVLYFFCHGSSKCGRGDRSEAGAFLKCFSDDLLRLDDLYMHVGNTSHLAGTPLVIINACDSTTLSGGIYGGFVPFFISKGARGIIGVDGAIPVVFAAEWAERFFCKFFSGIAVGQAIYELRREFFFKYNNLLGILYTMFCDGRTRLFPSMRVNQSKETRD